MNLDSILTFVGLALAVYSITPRAKWLDYMMRLNWFSYLIIVIGLLFVHYLQFFSSFGTLGLTPGMGLHRWGFNPQNFTYLIFISLTLLVVGQVNFSKLKPSRIKKFRQLLDELISKESYAELFDLLEKYIVDLFKIYNSEYAVFKIRKLLSNEITYCEMLDFANNNIKTYWDNNLEVHRIDNWRKYTYYLSKLLPCNKKSAEVVSDIISDIFLKKKFVIKMIHLKPYLGIEILKEKFFDRKDFVDSYFEALLKDNSSILYQELKDCQILEKAHKWKIRPTQKLLHFLFGDAHVAQNLEIYRPVGEYLIHYLDQMNKSPSEDLDRDEVSPMYNDRTKWESTTFVSIFFFDVMISAALHSKVTWHMWMYYMHYFVEKIIENMKGLDVEKNSRYKSLLEEILRMHRNWIESLTEISLAQPNVKIENSTLANPNGNIPISAMKSLASSFEPMVHSSVLDQKWKEEQAHCVFSIFFKLRTDELKAYSILLINYFKDKGYGDRRDEYKVFLIEAYNSYDKVPYYSERAECLKELEALISS